jgi:glutathione S-transferase
VDHKNKEGDFPVFETSAILLCNFPRAIFARLDSVFDIRALDLAQHYDPERTISYDPIKEPNLHSEELQWLFFAHGGVGPM